MKAVKKSLAVLISAGKSWQADHVAQWSAAVAYYTLFALPTIALVGLNLISLLVSRDFLVSQLSSLAVKENGGAAAGFIFDLLEQKTDTTSSLISLVISAGALFFAVTGFFGEVQRLLNTLFEVSSSTNKKWWSTLAKKGEVFISALVVIVTFIALLAVSTVLSAIIVDIQDWLQVPVFAIEGVHFLISWMLLSLFFTAGYRFIPMVKVEWGAAIAGGLVDALLFSIGKFLFSWYLSFSNLSSTFGVAASLAIFLVWIYYSAQIFFFGAEVAKVVWKGGST